MVERESADNIRVGTANIGVKWGSRRKFFSSLEISASSGGDQKNRIDSKAFFDMGFLVTLEHFLFGVGLVNIFLPEPS